MMVFNNIIIIIMTNKNRENEVEKQMEKEE